MRKFKKEVSICVGGYCRHGLESLAEGLILQAEEEDTIEELRAVLIYTLAKLTLKHESVKSLPEICE